MSRVMVEDQQDDYDLLAQYVLEAGYVVHAQVENRNRVQDCLEACEKVMNSLSQGGMKSDELIFILMMALHTLRKSHPVMKNQPVLETNKPTLV